VISGKWEKDCELMEREKRYIRICREEREMAEIKKNEENREKNRNS
jgi:hypothetical protein